MCVLYKNKLCDHKNRKSAPAAEVGIHLYVFFHNINRFIQWRLYTCFVCEQMALKMTSMNRNKAVEDQSSWT